MDKRDNSKAINTTIIVAIIGLLGTLIATTPKIMEILNSSSGFVKPKDGFVRYDDPYGMFSFEYPSYLTITERVMTDSDINLKATINNKSFSDVYDMYNGHVFIIEVYVSKVSVESGDFLSNHMDRIFRNIFSPASEDKLVSNEKTNMGYLTHIEIEVPGGLKNTVQFYNLTESDNTAYASLSIGKAGDRTDKFGEID